MVKVFVPTMLLPLTGGEKQVQLEADNVRQVVDRLEERYPGIKERLVEGGALRANVSVAVDGEVSRLGLLTRVAGNSEVHFVPAIGGG